MLTHTSTRKLVVDKAKKLGLRILTLAKLTKWFQDFQEYTEKTSTTKNQKVLFIRIEDKSKKYRPEIKIFRSFPKCNTDKDAHQCPFDFQQTYNLRSTKKCSNETCKLSITPHFAYVEESSGSNQGYCELCNLRFERRKDHLASAQHKKNITKESFKRVDKLIGNESEFDQFLNDHRSDKEIPRSEISTKSITPVMVQVG